MMKTREMVSSTFGQESKTVTHKGLREIKITSYSKDTGCGLNGSLSALW